MNLKSFFQGLAGLLRVSKVKGLDIDGLILYFIAEVFVLLEVELIVLHDRSELFLIRLMQYDVHGLNDVVFHSFGVSHG